MNNVDTVRPFGRSLYLHFSRTGESRSASTLQLDQGVTVSKDGPALIGRYHRGDSPFVIERFASEQLAATALSAVHAAMLRFAKRQRASGAAKGLVIWAVAPLVGAMFALALNAAVSRGPAAPSDAKAALAPPPVPAQALAQAPSPTASTAPPAAEVAKGMGNALKAGRFSVQVSSGSKGTLYVFSDPSCPHCRDFERQIDTLAKSYTIHVFPVSVVGGTASAGRIAQLLCTPPAERAAGWKVLINGGSLPKAQQCSDGTAAGQANDRIFHVLGLPGTPSLVAADGRLKPDEVSLRAESIDAWMQQGAAGR